MGTTDWLWLVAGAAVTALVILAVSYWIAQEARERRGPREPPAPAPPGADP